VHLLHGRGRRVDAVHGRQLEPEGQAPHHRLQQLARHRRREVEPQRDADGPLAGVAQPARSRQRHAGHPGQRRREQGADHPGQRQPGRLRNGRRGHGQQQGGGDPGGAAHGRQRVPAAAWQHPSMLAYRHAFHAGNHADVLKHIVLMQVLEHMNAKDKGWRFVDTHAGAGGYSLRSDYASKHAEYEQGIARLWGRDDLPPAVARYVDAVRRFNGGNRLEQYPGSPAFAHMLMRPQDQLHLYELHPTDHRILASYLGAEPGVQTHMADGFAAIRRELPPPTRRGLLLIDPSYELKADYGRVLVAVREALERFADGGVIVWLPQLQLLEAAQLPQRLTRAAGPARKGWLLAQLTVAPATARGFGLLGSGVFVINPPHTLEPALRGTLPWLARVLAQYDGASARVLTSAGG
jgi:23S rRNA (adenine2030-N6)-methyltransferase